MAEEAQVEMEIEYDGERYDFIAPKLSDLVAFEKQFSVKATELDAKPVFDDFGNQLVDAAGEPVTESNVAIEWMCFLFYRSLIRVGAIDKRDVKFDEDFIERICDIEVQNLPDDVTGEAATEELMAEDPSVTGA